MAAGGGGHPLPMPDTTQPGHDDEDDAERGAPMDPDPADEARQDGPGPGEDGTVPGAGTAGAGGAERARDDE